MMKCSLIKDYYVVTLECCELFTEQLERLPYLSFFAELLKDLDQSVCNFELKIRIIQKILPYLKRGQVAKLVETINKIINLPGRESIYALNLNPIRCGFLLH